MPFTAPKLLSFPCPSLEWNVTRERLAMCQKEFGRHDMDVAAARDTHQKIIAKLMRGPGDMENAMRRLEARYWVPWRTFWQLRYRPPSDVFVGVYLRLKAAYEAECERQERLLRHEREITKAKASAFEALAGAHADMDQQ